MTQRKHVKRSLIKDIKKQTGYTNVELIKINMRRLNWSKGDASLVLDGKSSHQDNPEIIKDLPSNVKKNSAPKEGKKEEYEEFIR